MKPPKTNTGKERDALVTREQVWQAFGAAQDGESRTNWLEELMKKEPELWLGVRVRMQQAVGSIALFVDKVDDALVVALRQELLTMALLVFTLDRQACVGHLLDGLETQQREPS